MRVNSAEDIEGELGKLPIAGQLSRDQLAALAAVGVAHDLAAQDVVQREGHQADWLWLVVRGRIALSLADAAEVKRTVGTISRGEFVGWTALVPDMCEQAHGEVLKPSRCIGFRADRLRATCDRDPAFGLAIMRFAFRAALRRMYDCELQVVDLYGHSV